VLCTGDGWNTAGWNSKGWNSVGWHSGGWNSDGGWTSGSWTNGGGCKLEPSAGRDAVSVAPLDETEPEETPAPPAPLDETEPEETEPGKPVIRSRTMSDDEATLAFGSRTFPDDRQPDNLLDAEYAADDGEVADSDAAEEAELAQLAKRHQEILEAKAARRQQQVLKGREANDEAARRAIEAKYEADREAREAAWAQDFCFCDVVHLPCDFALFLEPPVSLFPCVFFASGPEPW
jgi:hypothetical protein